ncbi:hypothetical protein MF271_10185 [Deinococcus sp. KNUC1210]|uniref:hypothetical protein n=1 Tax=Deinococcus sp. KNUC1210 TaxID=2917691 RepID=UPI001EF15AF9|nr:hypothetical protein [Deinococcus sp. KNUC1210]ULH14407.1 hypothetical protein MF271_10185 [Deinococcus sp. KNUC1210]
MIDSFLHGLKRTGERVQRRGEEVAQSARLRVDIFQLNRELDTLYARLGRAYHGSASVSVLEDIRADIRRVEEEIASRERLMTELTSAPVETAGVGGPNTAATLSPFAVSPAGASLQHSEPPPAQAALSVWREKEAARMSELKQGPITDTTGRPDGENADPTTTAGGDPHNNPLTRHQNAPTDPHDAGQGDKLEPGDKTASTGNEAARDEMFRHQNHLHEGEMATRDPDPLASKD